MSGSGLSPWSLVGNPAKYAAIVAHHVNCAPDLSHNHLMKCLRDISLNQLLSVEVREPEFGYAFGPSIDGVVIDVGDGFNHNNMGGGGGGSSSSGSGLGLGHHEIFEYNGGKSSPSQQQGHHTGGGHQPQQPNTLNLINSVLMRKTAINKLSR